MNDEKKEENFGMHTVTEEEVISVLQNSELTMYKLGEKTTVVLATLPNGFVITETSSCVDPVNYNEEVGYGICFNKIKEKVWELLGFMLQEHLSLTMSLDRKSVKTTAVNEKDN